MVRGGKWETCHCLSTVFRHLYFTCYVFSSPYNWVAIYLSINVFQNNRSLFYLASLRASQHQDECMI